MKNRLKKEIYIVLIIFALSLLLVILACVSSDPGIPGDSESTTGGDVTEDSAPAGDPLVVKIIIPDKKPEPEKAPVAEDDVVSGSSDSGGGGGNINPGPVRVTENYDYDADPIPTEAPRPRIISPPVPVKTAPPRPQPVTAGTKPDQAGDVWINERNITKNAGNAFTTTIKVNAGSQKLAAVGFKLYYDADVITPDVSKGKENIVVGNTDIGPIVNPNVQGTLEIAGFTAKGLDPSTNFLLFTVNWKAVAKGSTRITIDVDSLVDDTYKDIGTPRGFWSLVTVK